MVALLPDLLVFCCVILLTIVVLLGWGTIAWRVLAVAKPGRPDTGTVWLGYCIVSGLVEALHLFVAIDWKVTLGIGAVGLAGCVGDGAGLSQLRAAGRQFAGLLARYPWQAGLLGLLVLSWCLRAMAVPNNYDSGLYHFQSIRWINEEPIAFGLGNLHWRLALNQSYFGFLALLNVAPFWNKGYAAGGVVVLVLTLATLIETAWGQSMRWRCVFGASLLVFLGSVAGSIANPSPDNAVALLEVVIFLFLVRALSPHVENVADTRRGHAVALLLCVAVTCTKFSSAAFALGSIGVLAASLVHGRALRQVFTARFLLLTGFMGAVHFARGYILSGAPLFPATWFGAWQLEWAVPIGVAIVETVFIQNWAKMPGAGLSDATLQGAGWVTGWIGRQDHATLALLATGLLLMVINLARLRPKRRADPDRALVALYVPTVGALVFWFLTAPDVRFLGAVLVLFFLLSVYLAAGQLQPWAMRLVSVDHIGYRQMAILVFVLACLGSARNVGLSTLPLSGWPLVHAPVTVEKRTDSGAMVRIPESGNQCWDAPVPCASLFNAALRRGEIFSHALFTVKPD